MQEVIDNIYNLAEAFTNIYLPLLFIFIFSFTIPFVDIIETVKISEKADFIFLNRFIGSI